MSRTERKAERKAPIEAPVFRSVGRVIASALGLATLGFILLAVGFFLDRPRLAFAYLTAYAFVASTVIGALIFLMICHAMRAGWPVALRRLNEAVVLALPALAVLFVPLAFMLEPLYPFCRIDTVADEHARELLHYQASYQNPRLFLIRAAIYFVLWIAVGELLCRFSLRQDREPSPRPSDLPTRLSAGALPAVSLALVFASFDWLMSIEPGWVSTMFPVYVFGGGFIGALALLTLLTTLALRAGLLPSVSDSHFYALGRLLLAFTIFWAYAGFFQAMLIWITDRPSEIGFYLSRVQGPWKTMSFILMGAHFVVPFFVLLSYPVKRSPAALAVIAALLLVAHYLDAQWIVMPRSPSGAPIHFIDLGALLAVGGVTVAFAAARLRNRPMIPIHDPALPAALEYESV